MEKGRQDYREGILAFVEASVEKNGYSPTYDEIREAVGLSSKSHVNYCVVLLEEEGLLERQPNAPRGLRRAAAKE